MGWKGLWPALAFSAAAHLAVVAFGVLPMPEILTTQPKVIKAKLLAKTKRVQFAQSAPTRGGPTASIAPMAENAPKSGKAKHAGKPKAREKAASEPVRVAEGAASAVKHPEQVASKPKERPASSASTQVAKTEKTASSPQPPVSPPAKIKAPGNVFPRSGKATYRLAGFSFDFEQRWEIRPDGYSVKMKGGALGKSFDYLSEGRIGPDGIEPVRYQDRRDGNPDPKYFAEFDRAAGVVRYGEPGNPKTEPLAGDVQDLMSLAYQMAAVLEPGKPIEARVVVADKLYRLRLEARNEETIELPAGSIRTAHVVGRDLDKGTEWDIWLDLDHQNFPVRIKGVNSKGRKGDLQLSGLEFEGKTVYQYRPYEIRSRDK